jgi:GNAT superfamily N-acetyltransferase
MFVMLRRETPPHWQSLRHNWGYPTTPKEITERLPRVSEPRQERVIVAVNGANEVVAWTTVRIAVHIHSAAHAEVSGFVVDERMRGRGIGRLMMAEVERWSRENGLSAVRVNANITRTGAHLFYESLGFRIIKQQYAFRKDLQ